ncbi:SdrD B-like domain-containing protein [Pirellulales bacterium]|nr:SdrD B-like domain-containing protein [Pirellulales bacterium]
MTAIVPAHLVEITQRELADVTAGTPDDGDTLDGGVDNDLLIGDAGGDVLFGGWGDDVLLAHLINLPVTTHQEYIEGGPGDDFICGADGIDEIYGGTADLGLEGILAHAGATPTGGGYSLLSCTTGEVVVEPPPTDSNIAGVKFRDDNGDGVRDLGEALLAGWTISLLDGDNEVIATAVTDSQGAYLFDQLSPGDYQLTEEQQTDWLQTTSDYQISLGAGEDLVDLDFGNQFQGAAVVGQKWHDLNGNGVRDTGELPLNGWQIVLTDETGTEFVAVTADVDLNDDESIDPATERGVYQFVDLPSGNYSLHELPKAGWIGSALQLPNSDVFAPIVDDGYTQTRSDLIVDGTITALTQPIVTIDVTVNVDHPRVSDLTGFVLSPLGTRVDLTEFVGGPTDVFDPMIGEIPLGAWTLVLTDELEDEAGSLLDWQISITTVQSGPVHVIEGGAPSPFSPGRNLAYELSLAAGAVATRDFGNYRPAVVEGTKFVDLDGNGVRDVGGPAGDEPGLAGVVIYADLNGNNQLDRGEPNAVTQTDDPSTGEIDETGRYVLSPLPPTEAGQGYEIREAITGGYVQTFPAGGAGHLVTPLSGQTLSPRDFGNAPPASVHGVKWLDENGNGVRDEGEPGLQGVVIYADLNNNGQRDADEPSSYSMSQAPQLLIGDADIDGDVDGDDLAIWESDLDNVLLPSSTADFNFNLSVAGDDFLLWQRNFGETIEHLEGAYWLDGVPPGEAIIREIYPSNLAPTFPAAGFHLLTLDPGEVREGIDFGNQIVEIPLGSIHGTKWNDINADGVRDGNEPGLAGVVIYADLNNNGQRDAAEPFAVTMEDDGSTPEIDELGAYWLIDLPEGDYIVREETPEDSEPIFPQSGFHAVVLALGETVTEIDFGNWVFPDESGGDGDGDGDVDGDDLGYWQSGFAKKFTFPLLGNFNGDGETSGDDFLLWQREANRQPAPNAFVDGNPTAVHGMGPGMEGAIHGHKFEDLNGNGVWDAGEQPLPGWEIELTGADFDGDGDVDLDDRLIAVTNASGEYWFMDLLPANYTVREIQQQGWTQTTFGGFGMNGSLNVVPGTTDWVIEMGQPEDYFNVDFGNQRIPSDEASIHGQKWHDRNADAARDPNEEGLNGWQIELLDASGNVVAVAITMSMDANLDGEIDPITEQGVYWFNDVAPGMVQVREVIPEGWRQTVPGVIGGRQPGDANEDGVHDEADVMQVLEWDLFGTGQPAQWFQGDFNNDGQVDQADRDLADGTPFDPNGEGQYGGTIDVDLLPGSAVFGIDFANYEPIPLPDGDDLIYAAADNDVIRGDNLVSDPTVISVGTRRDTIFGQTGQDRIFGQEEDDILWGADPLLGSVAPNDDDDLIVGGIGIDELFQTVDVDQVLTDAQITGQGPDQLISIELATLTGGSSNNNIDASPFSGSVKLFGLAGNDTLTGTSQNDLLDGGPGSDSHIGGDGDDRYQFGPVPGGDPLEQDQIAELAGEGLDALDFSLLDTAVQVDLGSQMVAQQPGTGNVREVSMATNGQQANLEDIVGTSFGDQLTGNAAANRIWALAGTDDVLGGSGDDLIDLGSGTGETANGEGGKDRLVFFDNWGSAAISDSSGDDTVDFSALTMPLLVAVGSLQATSGANTVTHAGNDFEHLIGGIADDQFVFGAGAVLPAGGSIDAGPGADWIDYDAYLSPVAVSLFAGTATGAPGGISNFENVRGGQVADQITGDHGPNHLIGGPGGDTIDGLGQADRIEGEGGADILRGGDGDDLLIGGLNNDTLDGEEGGDTYSLDDVDGGDTLNDTGTAGTDALDLTSIVVDLTYAVGAPAAPGHTVVTIPGPTELIRFTGSIEQVVSGSGDDRVEMHSAGLLANVQFDAGPGVDAIDYANFGAAVIVNLSDDPFQDPDVVNPPIHLPQSANGLGAVINFEGVVGSSMNDLLVGNDADNQLDAGPGVDRVFGLAGDDEITTGPGRADMFGGPGNDRYIFVPGFISVSVDESIGSVGSGFAAAGGVDTIDARLITQSLTLDISAAPELENLFGSLTHAMILIGNDNSNVIVGGSAGDLLRGNGGDDLLVGLGGPDWLEGGAGNDVLLGGAGNDGTGLFQGNPRMFVGGPGRDILVGGTESDEIDADDDEEDIVIGGSTIYENPHTDPTQRAAWNALSKTWASQTLSRALRESLIASGVGEVGDGGPFLLIAGTTVFDTAPDILTYDSVVGGSPVDDLVFSDGSDTLVPQSFASGVNYGNPRSARLSRERAFAYEESALGDDLEIELGSKLDEETFDAVFSQL